MKKGSLKKIAIGSLMVFSTLIIVLSIHIYLVTRPKAPDAHTVVMARIDFKQGINNNDASKITEWLYQQKGVSHVLCNPQTGIAIFTFYPVQASANTIVDNLNASLHYNGVRHVPTEEEMKNGCPVASTSLSYKAYAMVKKLF